MDSKVSSLLQSGLSDGCLLIMLASSTTLARQKLTATLLKAEAHCLLLIRLFMVLCAAARCCYNAGWR